MTGGAERGGTGTGVAGLSLPQALLGAVVVELPAAARPRELAITGGAALRAADPLRRPGARRRGEPAAALGASPARDHAQSVTGAPERADFHAEPAAGAQGAQRITKAPPATASGGGAVDQQTAGRWIRGRAPLKPGSFAP